MFGYRKLGPGDARGFAEHIVRLSPDDRRSRFAGTVSDREVHRYCAALDWKTNTVIGFFDDSVIRAAVELRTSGNAEPVAEAAFSVERPFQGRGLGAALMRRIITVAQNSGIKRLSVICLPENTRMRHLLAKFNAESSVDLEEVVASIHLRPADPLSLAQESIDTSSGYLPLLFDRWYSNLVGAFLPAATIPRRVA